VDRFFNEIEKEKDFIQIKGITRKANLLAWYSDTTTSRCLRTYYHHRCSRRCIISSAIVTGGAVIIIGFVVGVPTVISVVIFIGRPGAQETPCHRFLLSRLIVFLLFRG
jgi:hypothetical protein